VDSGIQQQINQKFAAILNGADLSNKKDNNAVIKFIK
jgi:hypothetical protein